MDARRRPRLEELIRDERIDEARVMLLAMTPERRLECFERLDDVSLVASLCDPEILPEADTFIASRAVAAFQSGHVHDGYACMTSFLKATKSSSVQLLVDLNFPGLLVLAGCPDDQALRVLLALCKHAEARLPMILAGVCPLFVHALPRGTALRAILLVSQCPEGALAVIEAGGLQGLVQIRGEEDVFKAIMHLAEHTDLCDFPSREFARLVMSNPGEAALAAVEAVKAKVSRAPSTTALVPAEAAPLAIPEAQRLYYMEATAQLMHCPWALEAVAASGVVQALSASLPLMLHRLRDAEAACKAVLAVVENAETCSLLIRAGGVRAVYAAILASLVQNLFASTELCRALGLLAQHDYEQVCALPRIEEVLCRVFTVCAQPSQAHRGRFISLGAMVAIVQLCQRPEGLELMRQSDFPRIMSEVAADFAPCLANGLHEPKALTLLYRAMERIGVNEGLRQTLRQHKEVVNKYLGEALEIRGAVDQRDLDRLTLLASRRVGRHVTTQIVHDAIVDLQLEGILSAAQWPDPAPYQTRAMESAFANEDCQAAKMVIRVAVQAEATVQETRNALDSLLAP